MTKMRSKINRFFYRNQNRGIHSLMLYIGIGNLLVFLLMRLNPSDPFFYRLLAFDADRILSGELWRLVSYPFTYLCELRPMSGFLSLLFYYWCGILLEQYWGTLRFNVFYAGAVLLTDLAGILLALIAPAELGNYAWFLISGLGLGFAGYVNLSLLLAVATIMPDEQVQLYFVIPVKMKWLAWLNLGITLYDTLRFVLNLLQAGIPYVSLYLTVLIPLVPILNYLLFFGKQAAEILPDFLRYHPTRRSWQRKVRQINVCSSPDGGRAGGRSGSQARFRCTVCGRTELTNPGLEFRYCSKCSGYRCYCEEHIHNHVHITE